MASESKENGGSAGKTWQSCIFQVPFSTTPRPGFPATGRPRALSDVDFPCASSSVLKRLSQQCSRLSVCFQAQPPSPPGSASVLPRKANHSLSRWAAPLSILSVARLLSPPLPHATILLLGQGRVVCKEPWLSEGRTGQRQVLRARLRRPKSAETLVRCACPS